MDHSIVVPRGLKPASVRRLDAALKRRSSTVMLAVLRAIELAVLLTAFVAVALTLLFMLGRC